MEPTSPFVSPVFYRWLFGCSLFSFFSTLPCSSQLSPPPPNSHSFNHIDSPSTPLCLPYPPSSSEKGLPVRPCYLAPPPPRAHAASSAPSGVSFLTMGDWGLPGPHLSAVAHWMGVAAEQMSARFVLALGDNFYPHGVPSVEDSSWDMFGAVFNHKSLQQIPFYAILGNHDYELSPYSQIARHYVPFSRRWYMPNYWYYTIHKYVDVPKKISNPFKHVKRLVELSEGQDDQSAAEEEEATYHEEEEEEEGDEHVSKKMTVVTVFLDTIILSKTEVTDFGLPYDELCLKQLEFIKRALAAGSAVADWLFVVGHYELYSSGAHGDIESLKKVLLPLFAEYKVDAYFNGHDHHMELLYDGTAGTHFYVSGSASKQKNLHGVNHHLSLFSSDKFGFTSHVLTRKKMYSAFISSKGKILKSHTQAKRSKQIPRDPTASPPKFPAIELVYTGRTVDGCYHSYYIAVGMLIGLVGACVILIVTVILRRSKVVARWIRKSGSSSWTQMERLGSSSAHTTRPQVPIGMGSSSRWDDER
eukprot:GHVS01011568.1.p1 GENE.GHVS01011568.1~~GHVS01011568.1.p1  ORF type:complete len:529 (+),score=82.23 GHVS01011568.1:717-2303(+)